MIKELYDFRCFAHIYLTAICFVPFEYISGNTLFPEVRGLLMDLEYIWYTKYFYCVPFVLILGIGSFWKRKFVLKMSLGFLTNPKHAMFKMLI